MHSTGRKREREFARGFLFLALRTLLDDRTPSARYVYREHILAGGLCESGEHGAQVCPRDGIETSD